MGLSVITVAAQRAFVALCVISGAYGIYSDGGLAAATGPPAPQVQVTLIRGVVTIRYQFARPVPTAVERRPWMLVTNVDSRGTTDPQLIKKTPVLERVGVVKQSVGPGKYPFVVSVAALAKGGQRSRFIKLVCRSTDTRCRSSS